MEYARPTESKGCVFSQNSVFMDGERSQRCLFVEFLDILCTFLFIVSSQDE